MVACCLSGPSSQSRDDLGVPTLLMAAFQFTSALMLGASETRNLGSSIKDCIAAGGTLISHGSGLDGCDERLTLKENFGIPGSTVEIFGVGSLR